MSGMMTQCPSCGTLFRVSAQQLQARQGQVRCGVCSTVFDGYQTLLAPPEQAPAASVPQAAAAREAPAFKLEPVEPLAAAVPEPAIPARAVETRDAERDFGPAPEQLSLDDQLFLEEARARSRGARVWAAGSTLLVFVLAGQAAYLYRADLAAQYPPLKPYLVQLCDVLQCSVSLPQRPRLIAIEASDLQVNDPARPSVIQLTATLRNHAGYALAYPALDLVLTNTKEHTLARRIFLPTEYLDRGKDARSGIPASAEITVRLDLDTGDLNPAGFRLDLLPAPAQ
ncbi:MAG: DUF3426 domain-containing protein [Betaproteobacteria bacterium]|nr:DUF3426 domain-containing protein [Betaproteobacteria bacterium]